MTTEKHPDAGTDDEATPQAELTVQLPLHLFLRLHTLKLLKGQDEAESVRQALIRYFSDLDIPEAPEASTPEKARERSASDR